MIPLDRSSLDSDGNISVGWHDGHLQPLHHLWPPWSLQYKQYNNYLITWHSRKSIYLFFNCIIRSPHPAPQSNLRQLPFGKTESKLFRVARRVLMAIEVYRDTLTSPVARLLRYFTNIKHFNEKTPFWFNPCDASLRPEPIYQNRCFRPEMLSCGTQQHQHGRSQKSADTSRLTAASCCSLSASRNLPALWRTRSCNWKWDEVNKLTGTQR